MSRGHDRERALVNMLRNDDWIAIRAPASLGVADIIALKAGRMPRLIECKSTVQGPYEHFGPVARERLRFAAELAGAEAYLVWWPPLGKPRWIAASEWPVSLNVALSAELG